MFIKKDKSITLPPLIFSWKIYEFFRDGHGTQQIFTCSKLTIETQEKGVKYVQS